MSDNCVFFSAIIGIDCNHKPINNILSPPEILSHTKLLTSLEQCSTLSTLVVRETGISGQNLFSESRTNASTHTDRPISGQ